jgi:polar amino acid transport system substrate-binding protein
MTRPDRGVIRVFAGLLVAAVVLAGAVSSSAANRKIASEVPASVRRTGVLRVATSGGFDSDLARALASLMGLKVKFFAPPFPKVLPGVASHEYDLGMYSISDTRAREKVVDFVTYFMSGISFYVRTDSPRINTLSDLCGRKVGVPTATVEESAATAQSARCVSAGQPAVDVVRLTDERAVTNALLSREVDVAMVDTPFARFYVGRSGGKLMLTGRPFDVQPYGIASAEHSGLSRPVLDGLKLLISNGRYLAILTRWGMQTGAITHPRINGAIS